MNVIHQHDPDDCGAACLAGIATYYGKSISVAHIRLLAGTCDRGTTLADLQHAALRLGFQAEGVGGDYQSLLQAPLPAIVHFSHADTGDHFAVVTRADEHRITLLDPADGCRHRWPAEKYITYWSGTVLLLLPGPGFLADRSLPVSTWQRILMLLLPYRRQWIYACLLAAAATLLAMVGAWFVQLLADRVALHEQVVSIHRIGMLFIGVLLLQVAASAVRKSITLHTARRIDNRLLRSYCGHLLQLPQTVFNGMQPGELLSRMGDAIHIRRFANDLLIQTGIPMLGLLAVLILALATQPALSLWLLLGMVGYTGVFALGSSLHRHIQRRLMEADAGVDAQFTETIGAITTIKQLGLERLHGRKLDARIHDFLAAAHACGRVNVWTEEATSLLAQGFSLALLWGGGTLVLGGGLTLGELLAIYTLSGYFSTAAVQLMPLAKYAQEARIAADRLYGLLDLPPAEQRGATRFGPDDILPIVLNDVHFGYRRGQETLRGASLTLRPGTITLIRGASGSGKSTLLSLLLRQYAPTGGSITLGIHPLELTSRESLHRHIAIVPQLIHLFDDTFAANICLGEKPDLKKLEGLCFELGLLPVIDSWPEKLDTPLGPDGCLLSGGQRQLVAIARALYRQPKLLLLDEATSALDAKMEALVHRALLCRKAAGMATLWISHRASSASLADSVWHLHGGILTKPNNCLPYPSSHPNDRPAASAPARNTQVLSYTASKEAHGA